MSGVIVTGRAAEQSDLAIIEAEAREALREAGELAERSIRSADPRIGRHVVARVGRTATGGSVTIAPRKAEIHVVRFLEGGTGEAGPKRQAFGPKRKRALKFASGEIRAVSRGIRASRAFERTRASIDGQVEDILADHADIAARRIED